MICTRCIYDDHIPYITFDSEGVCNYCRQNDHLEIEYPTGEEGAQILERMVEQIKQDGRNKPYDVVVGISGGCDSSYMLYLAKKMGLRPLAAHFDNTWNSKIAVENIHNILKVLKIDLFTHVVDNFEFCDIFKSFLKASVPDIDTPSDIGLATTHYLAAAKYGIKYIFEGHSFRTEGISPHGWFYMDAKYIETVQKKFGRYALTTFPNLWMSKWLKWTIFNGIKKNPAALLFGLRQGKDEGASEQGAGMAVVWRSSHGKPHRLLHQQLLPAPEVQHRSALFGILRPGPFPQAVPGRGAPQD